MDPGILVPPIGYGGHERLIYIFAKEYLMLGHEVHLLVTKGSVVEGCTIHGYGKEGFPPSKRDKIFAVIKVWSFLLKYRNDFDLIHNFGRLFYLLPVLNHQIKKIMTYGREINKRNIIHINKFKNQNLVFTGCSKNLVSRGNVAGRWSTIYNAIKFSNYKLEEKVGKDAPLIFLGRLERVKGCHTAIKLARETGSKLIIAGNISPLLDEQYYFENELKPFIDGHQIVYVGSVNDQQKNYYLGKSKALIFPIEWEEPFGIVMIEAMACGTPVIAFNKGAASEVIDCGISGYLVNNFLEMCEKINELEFIDRKKCREISETRFDVKKVSLEYLSLFNPGNIV